MTVFIWPLSSSIAVAAKPAAFMLLWGTLPLSLSTSSSLSSVSFGFRYYCFPYARTLTLREKPSAAINLLNNGWQSTHLHTHTLKRILYCIQKPTAVAKHNNKYTQTSIKIYISVQSKLFKPRRKKRSCFANTIPIQSQLLL